MTVGAFEAGCTTITDAVRGPHVTTYSTVRDSVPLFSKAMNSISAAPSPASMEGAHQTASPVNFHWPLQSICNFALPPDSPIVRTEAESERVAKRCDTCNTASCVSERNVNSAKRSVSSIFSTAEKVTTSRSSPVRTEGTHHIHSPERVHDPALLTSRSRLPPAASNSSSSLLKERFFCCTGSFSQPINSNIMAATNKVRQFLITSLFKG